MKKLFLLDAYALIYRAYFALNKNPRVNSKGLNTSAIMGFLNTLYEVLKNENPTHIGVAFDLGEPIRRTENFAEYKANREETPPDIKISVPYIKEINLPGMQFLEVDINFSLDYKPGDTDLLEEMMNNTLFVKLGDFRVHTLRADDFFVHLCSHLYKEATTLPWVEMMRDMTLYKYCDIYMLLNDADKEHIDFLFERAVKLGMEKVCAFAVLQMAELFKFKNPYAVETATKALDTDQDFIHRIVSPKDKKELIFTERSVFERFFNDNRKGILEEVKNGESTKYEV